MCQRLVDELKIDIELLLLAVGSTGAVLMLGVAGPFLVEARPRSRWLDDPFYSV